MAKFYISKTATSGKALRAATTSESAKTSFSSAQPRRTGNAQARSQGGIEAKPYPAGFRNWPGVRMTGPLSSRFYADGNDAVSALLLVQAIQRVFYLAGAERVAIESVERGSVIAGGKAWWNGGDSKVVRDKMLDLAEAGEQWAMDTTANKAVTYASDNELRIGP